MLRCEMKQSALNMHKYRGTSRRQEQSHAKSKS